MMLGFQQEGFMSGITNLFKSKKNDSNNAIAVEMAKDYHKKATKAFKIFNKNFPEAGDYACYAIKINSINFKERKVEINFDPDKEIYCSNCKSDDELFEKKEFDRQSNMKKDCWFIGREYDEIQLFIGALRRLNFHPMWKFDEEHNNYELYPVFFAL